MKYYKLLLGSLTIILSCGDGSGKKTAVQQPVQNTFPDSRQKAPDTLLSNFMETTDTMPSNKLDTTDKTPSNIKQKYVFRYNLNKPDKTSKLSGKLKEFSGMSLSPDGKMLVAINDEEGKIFYLDKKDGEINETIKFENDGDYEGIESVNEKIYVVKSNGHIYKVSKPGKKKQETKTYKTELNSSNDVEGLAWDKSRNRLLIACKGDAGDDKETKGKRAIYGFDLEKKELIEKPLYLIDRNYIGKVFKKEGFIDKLAEALIPDQRSDAFGPSGIAIHPETSELYVISSVGKLLVILHPDGKILHMEKLDASLFRQPESICFDQDGTLYIGSEGKNGKAKLFRFSQH